MTAWLAPSLAQAQPWTKATLQCADTTLHAANVDAAKIYPKQQPSSPGQKAPQLSAQLLLSLVGVILLQPTGMLGGEV